MHNENTFHPWVQGLHSLVSSIPRALPHTAHQVISLPWPFNMPAPHLPRHFDASQKSTFSTVQPQQTINRHLMSKMHVRNKLINAFLPVLCLLKSYLSFEVYSYFTSSVKSLLTITAKVIFPRVLLILNKTVPLILITFHPALFYHIHRHYCPIKRNMPDTCLYYYRVSVQLPCKEWCSVFFRDGIV